MKHEKAKRRGNLMTRFMHSLELPENALGTCDSVSITDNCCIEINGCRSVLKYSPEHISVRTGNKIISAGGSGLQLDIFHGRRLEIRGDITKIDFLPLSSSHSDGA